GRYDDALQERSIAKLACEAALREHFDGPTLVTRVGIMVGPRDPTDRFTWWPLRFARALAGPADRRLLVPGHPSRPVQYTDVRRGRRRTGLPVGRGDCARRLRAGRRPRARRRVLVGARAAPALAHPPLRRSTADRHVYR